MAKAVGSDLRTTNSVISTWEGAEARVIPNVGGTHTEVIARQTGAAPGALLRECLDGATAPSEAAADGTRI
jgi:molecular chaperone DnaK (HSP70)